MAILSKQIGWSQESNLLWEILKQLNKLAGLLKSSSSSYKVYTALLTQESGNPLVVDVLENTIGDIVWSQVGTGQYQATLAGAFPLNKTALFINNSAWNNQNVTYISPVGTGDAISVETYNYLNSSLSNNILGYTTIEIRVYP